MTRKWLLALLTLIIVAPAMAQLVVRPVQRPVQIQPIPGPDVSAQQESDVAAKIMTIEEAQARIGQLLREKREINARLNESLAQIEQMTKKGGSLVHAYCESPNVSRNTAGATEECGAYTCGEVAGLCHKSCTTSAQCSTGRNCAYNECLTLAEVQARQN